MSTFASQLADFSALNQVTVPDLWQQQAVAALRDGEDVVVQAPTGAGKTLIFELWSNQGRNRGQAIYTVPTRALANDKLAEWRSRGWDVGIATGDLAENLEAPVLVATLETQKNRLLKGDGPGLLVVDEYQMLSDLDRGLNYELAIAMAPPETQLLLLSGSVANPQDVVKWLKRLGRRAVLIKHEQRPVPLEEVYANQLSYYVPPEIRGYWPRLVAKSLAEDLGPVLIFAPRRQAAEAMAAELARQLPTPNPLALSTEQKLVVGDHLAKLLKARISFHHSGLSYGARAGVIEPLAKAGQLRVVVATMGLAAGINFSLRSVALAGESYRRDEAEQLLRPDEIMQMFGRAGRRGLDETGYVLITANELRMLDAHPSHLSRSGAVDWSALLGIMAAAAERQQLSLDTAPNPNPNRNPNPTPNLKDLSSSHLPTQTPFAEAVRVQERLFTSKPVFLGVEESLRHPNVPCGLHTDPERARHVRKRVREMRNSKGEWETVRAWVPIPAKDVCVPDKATGKLTPALSVPEALEKVGMGTLCVLPPAPAGEPPQQPTPGATVQGETAPTPQPEISRIYGRALTVADRLQDSRVVITKWVRRLTNWNGRQAPFPVWQAEIAPLLEQRLAQQNTPVVRFVEQGRQILAQVSIAALPLRAAVDRYGVALWRPVDREVLPYDCAQCSLVEVCKNLSAATGTAMLWRRLGLVDARGVPTLRGRVVSFFSQGDGLAIAVALEDATYPLDELLYDVANLDAGFRFCGEDNRWGGRLAVVCHEKFGLQSVPGYLENGVPPKYGAGAEQVVASVHKNPANKHAWVTDLLGPGDIDRIIIEWRSLLRQLAHAPTLEWPRWQEFQKLAKSVLNETESPTMTQLPPLEYHQTRRVDHRLVLRRH